MTEIVRRGRLRWFGHVARKADDSKVKKCTKVEAVGKVSKGKGDALDCGSYIIIIISV